jgi:hypothetical protein
VPGPPQQGVKLVGVQQARKGKRFAGGPVQISRESGGRLQLSQGHLTSVDGALDFRMRSTETLGQKG